MKDVINLFIFYIVEKKDVSLFFTQGKDED